jgi:hypothetical protein
MFDVQGRDAMRTLKAKFAGRCFACDRAFEAGATVVYTGKCWHPECWEADAAKEAAEEAERTAKQEAFAKDLRAGKMVRTTVTETGPLKCGQPGTRGKLFVTWAPSAQVARDEANAFVASVRAAGGRAKLLGHTRNGKHYVGREVASYYGMSTMGHHEGYEYDFCVW